MVNPYRLDDSDAKKKENVEDDDVADDDELQNYTDENNGTRWNHA